MKTDTVFPELISIIENMPECRVPAGNLTASTRLQEDLGLDSIALIDLIVNIEDRFAVHIDPLIMDLQTAFKTVGTLGSFLEGLIENNKCQP